MLYNKVYDKTQLTTTLEGLESFLCSSLEFKVESLDHFECVIGQVEWSKCVKKMLCYERNSSSVLRMAENH